MKINRGVREKIILFVFSFFLLLYYLDGLRDTKSITIIGDEFGYWVTGAWLTGTDWSEVITNNMYYSYGYGIILAPLFFFIDDTVLMYQAALILNAIFIVFSFLMIYQIMKMLFMEVKQELLLICSFSVAFFCSFSFFAKVTMCEIWLNFVFIIVCRLLMNFIKEQNLFNAIILNASAVYIFIIHQRTIGVMLIVLFITALSVKQFDWKKMVLLIMVILAILALGVFIKQYYKDFYYAFSVALDTEDIYVSQKNDFSGQIAKIQYLFSIDGIYNFIKGFCGKIYYLGNSTYFLFYFGVAYIIKKIKMGLVEKKIDMLFFFLLSCIFASVSISTIFSFRSYDARLDVLYYGRYNEYLLYFVAVLGLIYIFTGKLSKTESGIVILTGIVLGLFCSGWSIKSVASDFNYSTCIGMSDIYYSYKKEGIGNVIYIFTLRSVLTAIIIFFISSIRKNVIIRGIIVGVILILSWNYTYERVTDGAFGYREHEQESNLEVATMIRESEQEELYYVASSQNLIWIDYMQFILKDVKVRCITDLGIVSELPKGQNVLTYIKDDVVNQRMEIEYTKIGESRRYYLWKK